LIKTQRNYQGLGTTRWAGDGGRPAKVPFLSSNVNTVHWMFSVLPVVLFSVIFCILYNLKFYPCLKQNCRNRSISSCSWWRCTFSTRLKIVLPIAVTLNNHCDPSHLPLEHDYKELYNKVLNHKIKLNLLNVLNRYVGDSWSLKTELN